MYRILYNNQVLHDPESDDRVVNDVSCMLSLVSASTLQLTVPKTNPLSGTFECMRRDREVTLERDGETVFRGRILTLDTDFWGNEVITAESERSYLNDILLPPFSTDGSIGVTVPSDPAGFFRWCILQYNAKQEGNHQFRFGFNQANELTDTIQANQEEWKSVWEAIKVRLMQRYGGWVRVRYSEGLPYIDYLTDSNQVNAQTVKFGENLLDYTDAKNGSELYTRILPTSQNGATISALADGTVAPGIVKSGEWVVSQTLENLYGVIEYVETFETDDPNKLLQDGIKRVKQVEVGSSLSITAFDLAMVDPTVSYIEPGDYVRVVSPPHGIDEYFICWEREIHPTDPAQDKINLGTTDIKLTTAQAQKLQELDDNKANVNLANATVDVVSDVQTVYAVSNSDSTQPSTWTASIPTTTDTYLWSKTTVTDVDGTEQDQVVVTQNPRNAGEASQYVTYEPNGFYAGLHVHENASSYNTDGDLHLTSGGLEIRDSGSVLADFTASTIHLGKNHTNNDPVVIDLMNGTGEIASVSSGAITVAGSAIVSIYGNKNNSTTDYISIAGNQTILARAGQSLTPEMIAHSGTVAARPLMLAAAVVDSTGSAGTSGYVLTSQGAGSPPIWAAVPAASLPFCHAVNTSATGSVGSTIKNVTLHSIDIQSADGSDYFEISGGGIKCKQAGKIEVNGSCYFNTATASWSRGVYLLKGSTEIGTNGYGSGYSTSVMACHAVTTVAAGDIIYLAARSSSSNSVLVNYATNLSIKYLEI